MGRGLVVVDIQNDYFSGGAHPLHRPEQAADRARLLLDAHRAAGLAVFHLQHVWDEPEATFMVPGTAGVEIHEAVRPAGGEPVIRKAFPNGFRDTDLRERLRAAGIDRLAICGMMTAMCVDATVRAAADLGFGVDLAHDACATRDLEFGGTTVAAADVHAAFVAALAGTYADVAAAADVAGGL
jgi:nicotinamidase-related amidase